MRAIGARKVPVESPKFTVMHHSKFLPKYFSLTGIIILATLTSCATTHHYDHSDFLDPYRKGFIQEVKNFSKAKVNGPIRFSTVRSREEMPVRVNGRLTLRIFVEETGHVHHVDILRRVDPKTDEALVQQFEGKRLEPAYLDGKPVKSILEVSFNFQSRISDFSRTRRFR